MSGKLGLRLPYCWKAYRTTACLRARLTQPTRPSPPQRSHQACHPETHPPACNGVHPLVVSVSGSAPSSSSSAAASAKPLLAAMYRGVQPLVVGASTAGGRDGGGATGGSREGKVSDSVAWFAATWFAPHSLQNRRRRRLAGWLAGGISRAAEQPGLACGPLLCKLPHHRQVALAAGVVQGRRPRRVALVKLQQQGRAGQGREESWKTEQHMADGMAHFCTGGSGM